MKIVKNYISYEHKLLSEKKISLEQILTLLLLTFLLQKKIYKF